MNSFGRPYKDGDVWRFGTSIDGASYPLGYCRDCPGHATPEKAAQHYQQMLSDKQGIPEVNALIRQMAEKQGVAGHGMELLGDILRAQPGQPDERRCVVCEAVFPLREGIEAKYQPWRCDACQERYAADADGDLIAERLARFAKLRDDLWRGCGVPDKYREDSFKTFTTTERTDSIQQAAEVAADWAHWFDITQAAGHRGLLFAGSVGTGKTHLAAAIARKVIENLMPTTEDVRRQLNEERAVVLAAKDADDVEAAQSYYRKPRFPIERFTVRFLVAPEFVNQLTDSRWHREGRDTEEDLYGKAISTRLLFLDDLGRVTRANQVEQQQEVWYRIFNGRYNNRLPMIVTTNKTLDELNAIVGEAVADRIVEMFDVVDMTGDSFRSQKRER